MSPPSGSSWTECGLSNHIGICIMGVFMSEPEKRFLLNPMEDCGSVFRETLAQIKDVTGAKTLILSPGRYVFRKRDAVLFPQPVTNTLVRGSDPTKHVGLFLDGLEDFTFEGNGALLLFDGDMTALALNHCRNITLKNVAVDYLRPRVSEMTLVRLDGTSAEFAIHSDSKYTVNSPDGFCWVNADGISEDRSVLQIAQCASPGSKSNLRIPNDPIRDAEHFELLSPDRVRFRYKIPFQGVIGAVYQFRHPTRNENGIFLHHCRNMEMNGLQLHFTPGLGIVAQLCENLEIRNHRHAPTEDSGRVCAAFADCVQISSCRGKVVIADSFFSGAQDDPINIHGTYLVVEKIAGKEIVVKFCHPETWGFVPFEPGDEIAMVCGISLRRLEILRVREVEQRDLLTISLVLENPPRGTYESGKTVVENLSANPDACIENCTFQCYPTRGLLLSSAGKCVVRGNTFYQTSRSAAILIAGDAQSWYESGGVRDVEIYGNHFVGCPVPAISIIPEIYAKSDTPVHGKIAIHGNTFSNCTNIWIQYHRVEQLTTDLSPGHIELLK